jgi:CRP-like cAMP-binding protein
MSSRHRVAGTCVDFLSLLPEPKREQLLAGAHRIRYPAASLAYVPDQPDYAAVLLRGLIRIYVATSGGRQATVHYVHADELLAWGLGDRSGIKVHVQAVSEAEVTILDIDRLRRLALADPDIAWALFRYMVGLEANSTRIIAVRTLGTLVERLAFDLLDRACTTQTESGQLVLHATQQQLADSIASAREVVARALRNLRDDGIIATSPGFVRVLDVRRLENIVSRALI